MLTLNQPPLTQHISIPKDMSQLSCEAFTAGIVEGVLDGLDVVNINVLLIGCSAKSWIARSGNRTYSRDGPIPSTDSYLDQAGSEGHGSRRSFGEVACSAIIPQHCI